MSATQRGRDRERDRGKVFVVPFQLKLVYRTVMLFADWVGSSQHFGGKGLENMLFSFLKEQRHILQIPNCTT